MTLSQIKNEAAHLQLLERFELQVYLADLDAERETDFQQTVSQRMSRMDRGEKITLEALESRHIELQNQGR